MLPIMNYTEYLTKLPFWAYIDEEDQWELQEQAMTATYQKGDYINTQNSSVGLLMILSGRLRVSVVSTEGREATLFLHAPGSIIPFVGNPRPDISISYHFEAEELTAALIIPSGLYQRLLSTNTYVTNYTYKLALNYFTEAIYTLQQMIFVSVDRRLAEFLLQESEIKKSNTLYLTHQQIAKSLGTAREVVSRVMKTFAAKGLLSCTRGMITLLDKKGLRSINEL